MDTSVIIEAEDVVSKNPFIMPEGKPSPIQSNSLWTLLNDSLPYLDEAFRPKEYTVSLDDLQELDWLLQPHLLALSRFLFPKGNLSFHKQYWICPKGSFKSGCGGFKISLRNGAIFNKGKILPGFNIFTLWLIYDRAPSLRAAVISLLEWIESQEKVEKKPEPLFHEDPEVLKMKFYQVMFGECFPTRTHHRQHRYRGNATKIWEAFRDIHGPVRTNDTPDFRSSYCMARWLKWCMGIVPQDFTVTMEQDSRYKTWIYVVTNNWSDRSPAMKKKLEGKTPLGTKVLSEEELLEGMQEELLWEPPPVDLEMAARLARIGEESCAVMTAVVEERRSMGWAPPSEIHFAF